MCILPRSGFVQQSHQGDGKKHRALCDTLCTIDNMSYLTRPIKFEKEAPSAEEIAEYIEEKSSQKVVITKGEFRGHYTVTLEKYPKDKLEFAREKNSIVIHGYAEAAPALCEILYTCLVMLGGKALPNIKLLKLPVSEKDIENINNGTREKIRTFGNYIWFYIISGILLVIGFVSILIMWVL